MDDFLKSKAMMTPGLAGAATTMITGTLVSQFGLPGNWTGLVVSLLMGLVVWIDKSVPVYQRLLFYLIHSMTIFAVAIGVNTAGMEIQHSNRPVSDPAAVERTVPLESEAFFQKWF